MKTKIIIGILLCLVLSQQDVEAISHPIGPSFVSTMTDKQRLYYNNLGTRLDCSAVGTPAPVLTWFRTNGSDDRPSTIVRSSELIDLYENGSLFIRPFRDYSKYFHAGTFLCRAANAAGSVQTTPIQLKPQIYDTYEIEVKNTFGFEQSSLVLSCEISPPSASSYVHVMGWLEKVDNQIIQLDLRPKTKYNFLSNKNLIIHNITKLDDNRTYACLVNNQIDNDTRQSRFKSLRVRDRSPFGPELSIPNNTEYRAQAGDLIELPCGISSVSTQARISWWKNGQEIENISAKLYNHSLILQLSSTSSNESGNYVCRIDDETGGRMTSSMSLKVDLSIQCQMLIPQPAFNAGSNTELICSTTSFKSHSNHWQWYHNSQAIPTIHNNQYVITNLSREHMGMYQCCYISSTSDSNTCCAQTQVRVINSPPFILTDRQTHSNIIISPSKNLSIDLNLTIYADPMPHIDIYQDNQLLVPNHPMKDLPSGDLFTDYRINLTDLRETGLYEYRVRNPFGSTAFSKHLNLEGQKPFIRPISNQTISSGQKFFLACYASGQPNLHLKWIDQTTKQILNTSFTSPLLLTSTNTKTNRYSCQANNPHGEDSKDVYITIQIPAQILSITPNRTIRINETLKISCAAEGDNDFLVEFQTPGLKPWNLMELKHAEQRNLSFTIEKIQMSDSGIYECSAKNNYSEDRSRFEILVQNVPDRIERIFMENSNRISWMKPFDGNARITKYLIRRKFKLSKDGLSIWSNEALITVDGSDQTYYSLGNFYSKCMISITIEAVNSIGSSLPSNPLHFQTNIQPLIIPPYNLTAVNISSKSVLLSWQYPIFEFCNESFLEYVIEIIDKDNQTILDTYKQPSAILLINNLKSFTQYSFVVYAMNELGTSPKSSMLTIETLESVPLAMVTELTAILLNSSSMRISWTLENDGWEYLHGRFRTFAVTTYQNFNMSTLITIETIDFNLVIDNLHSSTQYYISVMICNYIDCGPSSSAIHIETPSSIETPIIVPHPINKPLLLDCPSTSSWLHRENSIHQYTLPNNSLYIPQSKFNENHNRYHCGSKEYQIQYYSKPTAIQAKLHYTTSNEIGLKLHYPSDIIESLTITYKPKENPHWNEVHLSPPLQNIRLTNLSCGNLYEIMIYATNQVGLSSNEYLIGQTDGTLPSLLQSTDLIEVISNDFIILTMSNWIINQCSILSYQIDLFPSRNGSDMHLHRSYTFPSHFQTIKIDHLQSNEDYQLNIKVISQAGETMKIISFRTTNENLHSNPKTKNPYFVISIVIVSFIFTFILSIIVCILIKFCRLHLKNSDLFIGQTRKLKPMILSSYPDHYHSTWLKSNNEFTIENYPKNPTRSYSYASEDSQGNINPYAVTGCKDQESWCRENKHTDTIELRPSTTPSERYFRPIILESSLNDHQESSKRNPLVQIPLQHPSQPSSSVLSTVSSSQGELSSAFTYVPSSKQTTLNTKKLFFNNNNHILADQSSSSADSGVHSSYTQSPIAKHSFRKCQLHGFPFDRPLSANANDDQDKHFYATYDQHFAFLRREPTPNRRDQHEQYSLV